MQENKCKICKACGTIVSNTEEFCPECGCRCKQPPKFKPDYVLGLSVITFCFALISILINIVTNAYYTQIYTIIPFTTITISLGIYSFIKYKLAFKSLFSIFISIISLVIVLGFQKANVTVITFPSNKCETIFNMTAQKFDDQNGRGTIFEGNIISAKVDKKENLILKIDNNQKEKMEKECFSKFALNKGNSVVFSPNYDRITIEIYKETSSNVVTAHQTVRYCVFYQILNGKDVEDVNVEFIVLDAGNGKELMNINWPKIENNIETYTFDTESITSMW